MPETKRGTRRKSRGRPEGSGSKPRDLLLSEDQILELAAVNVKIEDIAHQAGCSRDTIERRYGEGIRRKRAEYRTRILRAQLAAAEKGNPAMLIWLGKQHLGQMETPPQPPSDPGDPGVVVDVGDKTVVIGVAGGLAAVRSQLAEQGIDLSARPTDVADP